MQFRLIQNIDSQVLKKELNLTISPLQWPEWGEVKKNQGWKPHKIG